MIAIVLAGGYATRLGGFVEDLPKPLLRVAGKPIIGHVFDRLAEIDDIERIIISTNLRFQQQFKEWLNTNVQRRVEILADRSHSQEEKPGALASLAQITSGLDDGCLVIAGDNLFTCSLRPMIHTFKARSCATVALYDVKDCRLAEQYSIAVMDAQNRIVSYEEKPAKPDTTLVGTCIYALPDRTLDSMREYLVDTADRDNPGRFIGWLCNREPVYGYVLSSARGHINANVICTQQTHAFSA